MYVYKITCLQNHRVYIGQTNNFKIRRTEHKKHLNKGIHSNIYLQEDYNKYDIDEFKFEILEIVETREAAIERESYWIDMFGGIESEQNYNIEDKNGRNSDLKCRISGKNAYMYGKHHTEKAREKMSKSKIGMYLGEHNPNYGNHKLRGSNHPMYNKHHKKETRDKISNARTKYTKEFIDILRDEHNQGVSCVDLSRKYYIAPNTISTLIKWGTTSPKQIKLLRTSINNKV